MVNTRSSSRKRKSIEQQHETDKKSIDKSIARNSIVEKNDSIENKNDKMKIKLNNANNSKESINNNIPSNNINDNNDEYDDDEEYYRHVVSLGRDAIIQRIEEAKKLKEHISYMMNPRSFWDQFPEIFKREIPLNEHPFKHLKLLMELRLEYINIQLELMELDEKLGTDDEDDDEDNGGNNEADNNGQDNNNEKRYNNIIINDENEKENFGNSCNQKMTNYSHHTMINDNNESNNNNNNDTTINGNNNDDIDMKMLECSQVDWNDKFM